MRGIYFERPMQIYLRDDLPKPVINNDEVLIKVKNCGICGSDISSFKNGDMSSQEMILGHEFSGEIIEMGINVNSFNIGDKVVANPNIPCLECNYCKSGNETLCIHHTIGVTHDGALAEYVKVRADRVHKLPESLSFEEGAMVEPLTIAVHAVKSSGFKIGDNAAVFGAGTIGLMTIQVLKAAGASIIFVIEPIEYKQKLALELGADFVFDAKKWNRVLKHTDKMGPDFIFDCVGIPDTVMNSLKLVKRGGFIMLIGMYSAPFEMKGLFLLTSKNLTFKGMYLVDQDAFKTAIRLIEQKKVNVTPLITRRINLEEVTESFKQLSDALHEDIKVMVKID
jgi:2-desacetyl-2-hydroxyethyl bacteriochlorophyllide A dehydrogenase